MSYLYRVLSGRIDAWHAENYSSAGYPASSYGGELFYVSLSDVPERKQDFVLGHYELAAPPAGSRVAVKLIDMLGEELLLMFEV